MNTQKNSLDLTPEEKLIQDNNLLKEKLKSEFGMTGNDFSKLDAETENQWLNYLYNFEKSIKDAKQIKVYEFIGKPEFRSLNSEELSPDEIRSELERIEDIMEENGIRLDVICEYENEEELIYKFITEELFSEEIEDFRIEGMNKCFIYEEFHPNHKYDLTEDSEYFLKKVFSGKWDEEFDRYRLDENVEYSGQIYSRDDFGKLIMEFQNPGDNIKINSTDVINVEFDLDKGIAFVKGDLSYISVKGKFIGEFTFHFNLDELGYWSICKIDLPEDIFI